MSVKLKSLALDLDRETNGGWMDSPSLPGVRYKVRGLNYAPYRNALDQGALRLAKSHTQERPSADVTQKVSGALVAEHILLEWDGFDETYSPTLAAETLTNPEYRHLLDDVMGAAARVAERDIQFVDDLGNVSPGISATS